MTTPTQSRMTSKTGCVFLVSCGKTKQKSTVPAKELYTSDRFKRERASVEATGCPWFVLSAKHHLLCPDEIIAPYDKALGEATQEDREAWAEEVKRQMDKYLPDGEIIVILAEKDYYEDLIPYLKKRFEKVMIPVVECHWRLCAKRKCREMRDRVFKFLFLMFRFRSSK